ncbi:protein SHORTAGE IN CHIASMATA 1-like isoform X2 [Malus domestica]|uniref:protein SHORTAGE IN CHIASMATA 1-like isoform X2 n=1 Tax=Malus domestica TaxID=3750 RepID=UPI003974EF0A
MRTRYLNIDYFIATPIQALESLTFLHLPILPLPPSNLSTAFDGLHHLRFHSELEVSLQIEQFPIAAALTKFFSDVLPQNIVLDVADFDAGDPSPSSRSFDSGSRELRFSETKAEDLKNEKGLEDQITFGSETLETAFRKENAYIYEKEELPFLSEEVPETENNLVCFS